MTIKARKNLLSHARQFFETELCELFRWDQVKHHAPEPAPRTELGRRNPIGYHLERVAMSFGPFVLRIQSPEDEPPLGWITLYCESAKVAEGPPDPLIWKHIGSEIKTRCGDGRGNQYRAA